MFSFSSFVFQYAKVRIFKKTELYNPSTTALIYQDIFNLKNEDGTVASTLEVPHLRGRPMVQTSMGVMVNASDTPQADYLTLWRINSPVSSAPTVTRTTLKGIWKYSYPASAPQLNSNVVFDTGPSSIGKVIQRDGKLYTARNTGYTDEPTTVTYDVIDLNSAKVLEQSRWVNGNFFYPAFDVPATMGPGQDLPNKLIVGTTTSSAGALTFAGLTGVKDGQDVFDLTSSGNKARWGDYNGAGIDPVTGGLWVSGEYAKTKNLGVSTYGTWNSFFPWGSSQAFDDVPSTNPDFNFLNVMKLWNITKGCSSTPSLYCPNDTATRETIAVFLIRSLYGDTFTYTNSPYFTDVPSTSTSFPYIQKMKDLGITLGCSPTIYCPATAATREMAAVFIIRAKMKNLFPSDNFPYPSTAYFTDVPSTNSNFSYIQKFRDMGITLGCSPTQYCPAQSLTREQLGVFIVRAFFN
jgi:hypothetical protein